MSWFIQVSPPREGCEQGQKRLTMDLKWQTRQGRSFCYLGLCLYHTHNRFTIKECLGLSVQIKGNDWLWQLLLRKLIKWGLKIDLWTSKWRSPVTGTTRVWQEWQRLNLDWGLCKTVGKEVETASTEAS